MAELTNAVHLFPRQGGFELRLPDLDGIYRETVPMPSDGFLLYWPVNPHITGWRGIARVIRHSEIFHQQNIYHKGEVFTPYDV